MAKTLKAYRDEIRALRNAGIGGFSARDGYKLSGGLTRGQKSAITVSSRRMASTASDDYASDDDDAAAFAAEYYADGYGDDYEEWEDIDWFDFAELAEFEDVEGDTYEETT